MRTTCRLNEPVTWRDEPGVTSVNIDFDERGVMFDCDSDTNDLSFLMGVVRPWLAGTMYMVAMAEADALRSMMWRLVREMELAGDIVGAMPGRLRSELHGIKRSAIGLDLHWVSSGESYDGNGAVHPENADEPYYIEERTVKRAVLSGNDQKGGAQELEITGDHLAKLIHMYQSVVDEDGKD